MSKKTKAAIAVNTTVTSNTSNPFLDRFQQQTIWHLVLLVLLPFFVYIKASGYNFIDFDDVSIIVNNYHIIGSIKNIGTAFTTDAFLSSHGDFYRPMQTVSFMLDAWIGGERPLVYHISNIVYHILTVVSLYYFLRTLNLKNLTALFTALLFSIHPLLTAAVSWIPARGDLLIGLFGILLFNCFDRYITTGKKAYGFLHVLLFALALFSKEVAVLFPLLLLFHAVMVRQMTDARQLLKLLLPILLSWVILIVLFWIMRSKVVTGTTPDFILGITPFISNLPTIPIVIAKAVIPAGLSTMPLFDTNFTIVGSLLLIVIVFLVIKYARAKNWLAVMGFTWFLLFIIPPMFFKLFFSNYLVEYYEHRTYLPLVGLMVLLAVMLNNKLFRAGKQWLNYLPLLLILIYTFLSSVHSDNFKDSISFFGRAAALDNPGAASKRGEIYYAERDFENASGDFEKAIEVSEGNYPPAFFNRAKLRSEAMKDHKGAEEDYTRAIELDSMASANIKGASTSSLYVEALISRANERIHTQNMQGALYDLAAAKKIDSNNSKIYFTLAGVYVNSSDFPAAVNAFSKTIGLDSNNAEAYNNRGYTFYRLKEYDKALKDCSKAIEIFPQFLNAYYNKGMIYYETGKTDIAIKTFDSTLALANNFYFGYFYRGMAKKNKNDLQGACADWQESVKLGFNLAQDTINRYCK